MACGVAAELAHGQAGGDAVARPGVVAVEGEAVGRAVAELHAVVDADERGERGRQVVVRERIVVRRGECTAQATTGGARKVSTSP